MSMSYTERARRRGGMSLPAFMDQMRLQGFIEVDIGARRVVATFVHPLTGDRRYEVPFRDGFSRALQRINQEFQQAKGNANV